jgi:hypothetical protein
MGAIKSRLGPPKGHDLATPEPSLGQGQPTPEDSRLARGPPQARDTPSPRPRPSLHQEATLAKSPRQPTVSQEHLRAIITLPLANSGYGEQDRRPIWLAPVKQVMMVPRMLHDDGGSQPPYGSKETLARTRQPRQLSFRKAPALLRWPRHHTNGAPKPLRLPRRHVLRALAPLC